MKTHNSSSQCVKIKSRPRCCPTTNSFYFILVFKNYLMSCLFCVCYFDILDNFLFFLSVLFVFSYFEFWCVIFVYTRPKFILGMEKYWWQNLHCESCTKLFVKIVIICVLTHNCIYSTTNRYILAIWYKPVVFYSWTKPWLPPVSFWFTRDTGGHQ